MKKENVFYVCFHHGDVKFALEITKILNKKDYDAFMDYFENPDNKNEYWMPHKAYNEKTKRYIDIRKEANFKRITDFDCEIG